jgi:hypothetical protein
MKDRFSSGWYGGLLFGLLISYVTEKSTLNGWITLALLLCSGIAINIIFRVLAMMWADKR